MFSQGQQGVTPHRSFKVLALAALLAIGAGLAVYAAYVTALTIAAAILLVRRDA